MPRKKSSPSTPHFEQSVKQLTELIEKMESGNLSLEESLQNFEKGITLIRDCQKILTDAEKKVQILTQQTGEAVLRPYPPEDPS